MGTAVSSSTNTLTNAGGIFAPGDIGTTGKTTITGNYSVTSPTASLAIDIDGASASGAFQDSAAGYYDNAAISRIGRDRRPAPFTVNSSYTPANNTTTLYTFLTGSAGGHRRIYQSDDATSGNKRVVGADGLTSFLVATNNTASSATVGGLTSVPAYSIALGGYQSTNSYIAASGSSWDAVNAASWSSFDPGATSSPATQASGAIARLPMEVQPEQLPIPLT